MYFALLSGWPAEAGEHQLTVQLEQPLILRFSLQVDGVHVSELSDEWLAKLFAHFDRDGDGALNPRERGSLPSADALQRMLLGDFANLHASNQEAPGGEVETRVDLRAFYQRRGIAGWVVIPQPPEPGGDERLNALLFESLAGDDPRGIGRESFLRAAERLAWWDRDGDEWWTLAELTADLHQRPRDEPAAVAVRGAYHAEVGTPSREPIRALLSAHGDRVSWTLPGEAGSHPAWRNRQASTATLVRDRDWITIALRSGQGGADFATRREELRQQWESDDTDQNQRLTPAEIDASPLVDSWRALLTAGDRDQDGRLSLVELNALLDLLALGAERLVVVRVVEPRRNLFQSLDTNRDGRISLREWSQGTQWIAPWDRNGDGYVDRGELPRRGFVSIGVGGWLDSSQGVVKPLPDRVAGPRWFEQMDRNGDGDVSRREFLGPPAAFQRLDRNGDHLIDSDEARHGAP